MKAKKKKHENLVVIYIPHTTSNEEYDTIKEKFHKSFPDFNICLISSQRSDFEFHFLVDNKKTVIRD